MSRPRGLFLRLSPGEEAQLVALRSGGASLKECVRLTGYGRDVVGRTLARHPEADPVLRRDARIATNKRSGGIWAS